MSEDTSVQAGLPAIGDAVENAVAGNAEQSEQTESTENQVEASESAQQQAADAKATLKDPKASKAEKKAAQKTLKKLTLKVDGEEYEEELPFEIPDDPKAIEYMKRELQLGKMGQKRAQEKANIEKEVLKFIEDLRKDPKKALSDPAIGLDLKQLAAQIIEEEIENAKKSPEQLEKEKLEAELKAIKEEREKEKEAQKQQELQRLTEQEYERYDILMSQALEKADLPKTPYIVKKIADYMLTGLNQGKDITPDDVIPLVREEMMDDIKQLFAVAPDEILEQMIGKGRLDNYRKRNIAKAKQATSNNPGVKAATKTPDTGKKTESKEPEKKVDYKKFFGI